ncbi:MAG: cytochrome c-type biogenesis protein CcmH [Terriglobales bacterium]|jgi:cytochrome c-type biogenesis protein CcmH
MKTYDASVSGTARAGTVQQGTAFSRAVTALFVGTARLKAVPSQAVLSRHSVQIVVLLFAVFVCLGAGDENARFSALGHKLMCVCSCNQVLLECNHVGCSYSDRMRGELAAALDRADSDDLVLQSFVQKYGPTVLLAPTATGFNRVAWVIPYLALALGLTTVVLIVRAWRTRPLVMPAGGVAPASPAEFKRFRDQARRETEL